VGSDFVVFEPASRHSFKEGVGRQIANPTAMILSCANMLNHLHVSRISINCNQKNLVERIRKCTHQSSYKNDQGRKSQDQVNLLVLNWIKSNYFAETWAATIPPAIWHLPSWITSSSSLTHMVVKLKLGYHCSVF
jgi:isocitrate dehydrogenase